MPATLPSCYSGSDPAGRPHATEEEAVEQHQLQRIAEEYLCPLFSGAWLAGAVDSTPGEQRVARRDSRSLAFKVDADDSYRLILRRGEKFGLTAQQIVKSFVDVLRDIEPALSTLYEQDVL